MALTPFKTVLAELGRLGAAMLLVTILFGAGWGVLTAVSLSVWVREPAWYSIGLVELALGASATWLLLRRPERWLASGVATGVGTLIFAGTQVYMWWVEGVVLSGGLKGPFGELIESGPNGIAGMASASIALPICLGALAGSVVWATQLLSRRTSAST